MARSNIMDQSSKYFGVLRPQLVVPWSLLELLRFYLPLNRLH